MKRRPPFSDLVQDVRYALRTLRRGPGFLFVVILTVALGIGANTAIFSVLRTVVLRPLPYPEPDRLVTVWTPQVRYGFNPLSAPDYLDYKEACRSFEAWGAYVSQVANLSGGEEPIRVTTVASTADLLRALGVEPALGRLFGDEEAEDPGSRLAIMSDGLWKRRFGADPALVGRPIVINRENWTVIGIMPQGFRFPDWRRLTEPDLVLPLSIAGTGADRGSYYLRVAGRLGKGVSPDSAEADLKVIAARLQEAYPESNDRRTARVVPLREIILGDTGQDLWILVAVVGFVLLIACTNVAGLLMSRCARRNVEMAVRASLGAGRRRLLRQMLSESSVLAFLGGAAGLVLAWWAVGILRGATPGDLPRIDELGIDGAVLVVTLCVILLTGVLFGIVPAFSTSGVDLTQTFREGGRALSAGKHRVRFFSVMIVAQFALTFVLADGAALMLKSLWNATSYRELNRPEKVLIAGYSPGEGDREDIIVPDPFLDRLLERLRGLPGVASAGATTRLPLDALRGGWTAGILAEGQVYDPKVDRGFVYVVCVSPGYFEAMGIPLRQGRSLLPEDGDKGHLGVVVNRSFAERSWPGEDPLGKRVRSNAATPWFEATVVGVVEDVRQNGLEHPPEREIYIPFFPGFQRDRWLALRTTGDPLSLVPSLRRELAALDPHLPLTRVFTGADLYDSMAVDRRFTTALIGLFALVALCLITAGTYGMMAYQVAQRTHEMGIRIALGAERRKVMGLVLGRSLRLVLIGIALGVLGSVAVAGITESLLYNIEPLNPLFLAGAGLFLMLVAVMATFAPALRAVHIDPAEAMRQE